MATPLAASIDEHSVVLMSKVMDIITEVIEVIFDDDAATPEEEAEA